MGKKTNTATTLDKNGVQLQQATGDFYIADSSTLTMTKKADKETSPGVYEYYVKGDTITFTITITNGPDAKIKSLKFEDQIDATISLPTTAPYGVTTTKGTIAPPVSNKVSITNIDLDKNEICTITITGTIL